ncbi:MAG TPA: pyridoxamine 5'-phosphate oxidase family protein [Acidimicrobiales bacterium]|nr:pyridoxamine 5'-phosphate oxidase family protein [Acidimicrobiales bacterium]
MPSTPAPSTPAPSTPAPRPTLSELTRDECFDLLNTQVVGRLAVAAPGQAPLVVPVNFVVDGDAIVFRSDAGTKLALLSTNPVSFQVDVVDPNRRGGWSVLASGRAGEVGSWEVGHLAVEPWAGGDKRRWVRLIVERVTGRRLEPPELSWQDSRGYL